MSHSHQLSNMSSAELMLAMLDANKDAQKTWVKPVIGTGVVAGILSCSTSSHRLSDIFGRQQVWIDNIRLPLATFNAVTTEALALAAYAHGVKLLVRIASPHPGSFHPHAVEATVSADAHAPRMQRQSWHNLKTHPAFPENREVMVARLGIDSETLRLSIRSLWIGSNKVGSHEDLNRYLEIGREMESSEMPLSDWSPHQVLGYLLHLNHVAYMQQRAVSPTLGMVIQCMDSRTSLYGANSFFGNLPMRMHRIRTPGSLIPEDSIDAIISSIIGDRLRSVVLMTHDDTCAMCAAAKKHKENPHGGTRHFPHLLEDLSNREATWAKILKHPLVAQRIEDGRLCAARMHMNIHKGSLHLLSYHGTESHLLDSHIVK